MSESGRYEDDSSGRWSGAAMQGAASTERCFVCLIGGGYVSVDKKKVEWKIE